MAVVSYNAVCPARAPAGARPPESSLIEAHLAEGAALPPPPVPDTARIDRALALARERIGESTGRTGEPVLGHGQGTMSILAELGADEATQVAALLFGAGDTLGREEIELAFGQDEPSRAFGRETAELVEGIRQVLRMREVQIRMSGQADGGQLETLRRMLLAMSADIRVVMLRLASRLQTLRWHASARRDLEPGVAVQTLNVLAPLANRLGLWQLKWELEDLAFRFNSPDEYRSLARELEEKRREREEFVAAATDRVREALAEAGVRAEVSGRPKHIYSIWNKMRAKRRPLDEIQDLRGLRVIVDDVRDCYTALGVIHERWPPITAEFDDYIARPKPNGYQSLHTVVVAHDGKPLEVQIRTQDMHRFAEYGVASHWRYKERTTGVAGAARSHAEQDERIAWIRQLLAWQREVGTELGSGAVPSTAGDRIFVLTPQARVIELPAGSTPVDFAYHVHTALGHRCRGARVDGQMVPLNTELHTGQTVEIIAIKPGSGNEGPSRDWLNVQLGYVRSPRARSKVRQWFSALELERDVAAGRERVERVLQREGRTALAFEELATRLGQPDVEAMFIAVTREEIGPRQLEEAVRGQAGRAPAEAGDSDEAALAAIEQRGRPSARRKPADGGVLVVGVDLLMTQLARCCRPVPPDPIVGFVTKGKGVSVHREGCTMFAKMAQQAPERVLETTWGERRPAAGARDRASGYPVDLVVRAMDRPGLLRDVTEVFARDKLNVTAVQTLSRQQVANMQFTIEVPDGSVLSKALAAIGEVAGVIDARRR